MSTFDPIKALREEIYGLGEIRTTIVKRVRAAEQRMGEAEAEYNDSVKLKGFCDAEIARKREVLTQLENANAH